MSIFQRITKLLSANINHMLDKAEDPEVMVKQIIREMEESIIELRRETVKSISAEKQLQQKIEMAKKREKDLDSKAALALAEGDEDFARKILEKKLEVQNSLEHLQRDLGSAANLAEKLKGDLTKLEDQVQIARRKKEELIRRKRSAEAKMRTHEALKKSRDAMSAIADADASINEHTGAIESYRDKILQMEAEAEATEELLNMDTKKELNLEKMTRDRAVEDELAKLKAKLKKSNK